MDESPLTSSALKPWTTQRSLQRRHSRDRYRLLPGADVKFASALCLVYLFATHAAAASAVTPESKKL
jgi:hypothetical protein